MDEDSESSFPASEVAFGAGVETGSGVGAGVDAGSAALGCSVFGASATGLGATFAWGQPPKGLCCAGSGAGVVCSVSTEKGDGGGVSCRGAGSCLAVSAGLLWRAFAAVGASYPNSLGSDI